MALTKVKGSVADPIYLNEDENLADLPDKAVARQNLDVPGNAPKNGKVYVMQDGQWIEMVQSIQLPVGAIISWPGKSAPAGWLAIEPVTVYKRTDYPALYKHFQDECPHLIIDADTFKLAEGRGVFIRGYDPTGVNDPDGVGRELLTPQADAMQNITGGIDRIISKSAPVTTGAFKVSNSSGGYSYNGGGEKFWEFSFDASRVVPTAAENRPKNLNALWIIKAYDTVADPELLQAKAVIDQVNSNSGRIQVLEDKKLPIDYQLIDFGVVSKGSRYVKPNPFGNSKPVIVVAEIYVYEQWAGTGWVENGGGNGVNGWYVDGQGIIVRTGNRGVMGGNPLSYGSGHNTTNNSVVSSASCRVHVWRVGV